MEDPAVAVDFDGDQYRTVAVLYLAVDMWQEGILTDQKFNESWVRDGS